MLLTLAREYRELYDAIGAHLRPRDAHALAYTCVYLRTCAPDIAHHLTRLSPTLHAISRIQYRVLPHIYAWNMSGSYFIKVCNDSVRTCANGTVAYYLLYGGYMRYSKTTATESLCAVGAHSGTRMSISEYSDHTVCMSRGIDNQWAYHAQCAWATRTLLLQHMIEVQDIRSRLYMLLIERDLRAIANTNYDHFSQPMRSYATVGRGATRVRSRCSYPTGSALSFAGKSTI